MTRREFDLQTQENWGGRGRMASDERDNYRDRRILPHRGWEGEFGGDLLQRRAFSSHYTGCKTFNRGSCWVVRAVYRLRAELGRTAWGCKLLAGYGLFQQTTTK
jgi:hypothetical protein